MSKKNKRKSHLYSSQPLKENVKRIILKRCFKFVEEEAKYKCTCCPDNGSCNYFDSASKAYNHTFTLLFEALGTTLFSFQKVQNTAKILFE